MKKVLQSSLFIAMLFTARSAGATNTWPILETSSQAQCAWMARDTAAHIFENDAQWKRIFPDGQTRAFKRSPDWSRQVVVALTLGVRPTPGFTIELTGKQFALTDEVLRLDFREQIPATDNMSLQVITQPCIFILTPRGKWRHAVLRNADSGAELTTNTPDAPDTTRNKRSISPKRR